MVAPLNTPVKAPTDGYMFHNPGTGSAGNSCEFRHADNAGWADVFSHLSGYVGISGQYFAKGATIAYSGDSGNVAAHLHRHLLDPDGNRRNPWNYFTIGEPMPEFINYTDDRTPARPLPQNEWTVIYIEPTGTAGVFVRDGGLIDANLKFAVSGLAEGDVVQTRFARVDVNSDGTRPVTLAYKSVDTVGTGEAVTVGQNVEKFFLQDGNSKGAQAQIRPLTAGVTLNWSEVRAFKFA